MVRFTEPGADWNDHRLTVTSKPVSDAGGTSNQSVSDAR